MEFRVRNLLFGPIPRWYFLGPLETGYQKILKNIQQMVGKGVLQVQDLTGTSDKGQYSYKVFAMWPSANFFSIQSIRPVSQWVSQSIAQVAAYTELKGFETFVLAAEGEPALKVAAENLFERYAHERLAQGGTFKAVEDGSDVVLRTRQIKYFSGLAVSVDPEWRKDTSYYWVPRNQNFTIVDSITPNHMIQVALAKSRKPMDRAVFSRLQSDLNQDAYMVLVKPEGDGRSAPVIKFRSSNKQKVLSDEDKQLVLAGDLRYHQIQALCKKYKIRANQHKEVMLKELKELVAIANVQNGGGMQEEQLRPIVKTIALRSGFSVDSNWRYPTLEELFTSVKNDIHYGDYEPFFGLEDDAVEDNRHAAMDNWDIKLGFHGDGTASGFESEIVYTALMEETQVTLKLAHLDGTLAGKQVRVKAGNRVAGGGMGSGSRSHSLVLSMAHLGLELLGLKEVQTRVRSGSRVFVMLGQESNRHPGQLFPTDDAVDRYVVMDNWDIKFGFHGGGTASGFESEIVYTALMEETQVTLKLAHLDGTLVGKQVRVKREWKWKIVKLSGLRIVNFHSDLQASIVQFWALFEKFMANASSSGCDPATLTPFNNSLTFVVQINKKLLQEIDLRSEFEGKQQHVKGTTYLYLKYVYLFSNNIDTFKT
ncbi:hypothetical protein SELMODRAFT_422425 [Selaginella moellendorffii]|uniref:Uncharacterized protein n=1 Tax=Selaginella moellendorffii TaxID=88036 RepID=D8SIC5_SELML|nr:hypothetical protein SELMODRAFT_422425 [Selaginella moellendorffii]